MIFNIYHYQRFVAPPTPTYNYQITLFYIINIYEDINSCVTRGTRLNREDRVGIVGSSSQNNFLLWSRQIQTQIRFTNQKRIKTHPVIYYLNWFKGISSNMKIEFTEADFQPELFTFRLVHPKYEKLTEPVMAQYSTDDGNFKAVIDLGDPKTIKPYSDIYQLELIISDERLENSIRKKIANGKVNFRHSVDHVPEQYNEYQPQSIIRSDPPSERIDPPQIFTAFVLAVDVIVTLLFLYGLYYLRVNVNLLL